MEIVNIVEGHANLALKKLGIADTEVELLAQLRESICKRQCKANNGNTYLDEKNKCTACGCNMEAKWRATEAKCIIGAW